jgi:hypothetical protein
MLQPIATLTDTLRGQMRRRTVERQLLDLVARLPEHPESRATYQRLLEEHMRLEAAAERPARSGREFAPAPASAR